MFGWHTCEQRFIYFFAKSDVVVIMTHGFTNVRCQSKVDRQTQDSLASWSECFVLHIVCYNQPIVGLIQMPNKFLSLGFCRFCVAAFIVLPPL